MSEDERLKYNMGELDCTYREAEIHGMLMQLPCNLYPKSLTNYISKQSKIYGWCGDVHAECVIDWMKGKDTDV